jgi:HK97 gp10 family phage protein
MRTVNLNTSELDKIAKGLNMHVNTIARSLAFDVEREAKILAPVDTGALRSSIYTVAYKYSGEGVAQNAVIRMQGTGHKRKGKVSYARARTRAKEGKYGEFTPLPGLSGKILAIVGPSVEYAEAVELGSSNRAARPFLVPAVEKVAKKLDDETTWKELFE